MIQERQLDDYFIQYQNLPFESVQETFRKKAIIDFINPLHVKSALEIGCGRRSIFCDYPKFETATIVEPINEFLDKAIQDLSETTIELNPVMSFIETAKLGKHQTYETVIVSSLLHEVSNPEKILGEIKKYMNFNSELIVVVNNRDSIHRVLGHHLGILESLDGLTETNIRMQQSGGVFSIDGLESFLTSSGFAVQRLETFMPKILPHASLQEALDTKIISMNFIEECYELSGYFPALGSEIIAKARMA
jgi:hypothetical protein